MSALSRSRLVITLLVGMVGITTGARATPLDATNLINTYNLIVFNNLTNNSHVDGSALVGGNTMGGTYAQHVNLAGTALTVGKTLSGGVTLNGSGLIVGGTIATSYLNGNGGGDFYIGGNVSSGWVNANSSKVYLGGSIAPGAGINNATSLSLNSSVATNKIAAVTSDIAAAQSSLTAYSRQLSTLAADSTISSNNYGLLTFNATPGADGVAVFSITSAALLNSAREIVFSLNGAKEVVINVSGIGASQLTLNANFLAGSAQQLGTNTVWNFTDAAKIDVTSQFGGTILAVLADLSNSQNIEGTVIAKNLIQNGEIHYDGVNANLVSPVPLPGALTLFGSALFGLGAFARRGRKRRGDAPSDADASR
ncbi:choice-of-anchor A family protein [Magnetospirillum fulvum]|uniref:Choice-of-anchor A domain-containing protein n=1 Tax=Magnetospirillum fulvum TaxID=1082 RepID=A0A1H6H3B6_MAGFU|nr:choice-of-anchor A family protein [Magnetospirillum fulvum]SEH30347.1 choice-of-anchor A domain-containing protein [Magnetospirillum fulvum]